MATENEKLANASAKINELLKLNAEGSAENERLRKALDEKASADNKLDAGAMAKVARAKEIEAENARLRNELENARKLTGAHVGTTPVAKVKFTTHDVEYEKDDDGKIKTDRRGRPILVTGDNGVPIVSERVIYNAGDPLKFDPRVSIPKEHSGIKKGREWELR